MKNSRFFRQAEFLLQILPFFAREKRFALKGGTGINFFVRNLPRISVDIDFAYLPINSREEALKDISIILAESAKRIEQGLSINRIEKKYVKGSKKIAGLIVFKDDISIKIEPNLVIRGSVFPARKMSLCTSAQELFEQSIDFTILSLPDIYGGKICAVLDRQHPRDLFDINVLLENEGFTDDIRKSFIVYLISHPRPMFELLNPNLINISQVYENEFRGMTKKDISCKVLEQTRVTLIKLIKEKLTTKERHFIVSVKELNPQWDLLGIKNVKELPAVKWKLLNLRSMGKSKHQSAVKKLKDYLEIV
ncbi:nucleotidyl transferase AbiEii/AbiGii toxin family protein [Chlamydiota bacterium]